MTSTWNVSLFSSHFSITLWMYVTFFHLNHSNILPFVSVPFNVGQTTDISKEPLHGQAALRRRRNVFSYENIGELPAHRSNAGGGSGLGIHSVLLRTAGLFSEEQIPSRGTDNPVGAGEPGEQRGRRQSLKEVLEQTSFSSIKSTGRKLGLWIKLQNGAFSNVSDLCDMFDFSAVTLGSAAEVAKCDWLHARR